MAAACLIWSVCCALWWCLSDGSVSLRWCCISEIVLVSQMMPCFLDGVNDVVSFRWYCVSQMVLCLSDGDVSLRWWCVSQIVVCLSDSAVFLSAGAVSLRWCYVPQIVLCVLQMVLCMASSYFRRVLCDNSPGVRNVVVLRDIPHLEMRNILQFLYTWVEFPSRDEEHPSFPYKQVAFPLGDDSQTKNSYTSELSSHMKMRNFLQF